jgi:hypothetical protein
MKCQKEKC